VSIATTLPGNSMLRYILSSGTSTSIKDPNKFEVRWNIDTFIVIKIFNHMSDYFSCSDG
jgi:hypothetical protein